MDENQPTRSQRRRVYLREAKRRQRLREAMQRQAQDRFTQITVATFLNLLSRGKRQR